MAPEKAFSEFITIVVGGRFPDMATCQTVVRPRCWSKNYGLETNRDQKATLRKTSKALSLDAHFEEECGPQITLHMEKFNINPLK
ncbi:unnamed protein product [Thelazia callipaeda]|uniref:Uncharacterized protein n=1 Tax=Thelazia callipaeda TaxID=103827 RepID=A0A0N5CKT3_THECL|nr:unnamed protein product [Thelazia callipaeda]